MLRGEREPRSAHHARDARSRHRQTSPSRTTGTRMSTIPEPAQKIATAAQARNINEVDEARWARMAANFRTIAGAVLLALVSRTCLFEAFEIEGPSMEPT